ncbi:hypothetical protein HKBW3S43_00200, partial [Candidatus Hakubella thermalkaliphila]
KNSA